MHLQTGTRLGPYEVLQLLGSGGMGEVYRARDTRLDRTVAIKVLAPQLGTHEEFRLRFEREARLASALDHPHICTVFDVGHENGVAYFVMQNVRGETMARRLARSTLSLDAALEYAVQIASGLAAAHSAGILHRDLKPANVMITDEGFVKILDFGLAKLAAVAQTGESGETRPPIGLPDGPLTLAGVVLGTAAYMSPEQVEGRHIDTRSDLFSFGALLYEMLTGRSAFDRDSTLASALAVVNDAPAPCRQIRPDVPTDVDRVVRRCLEKNPNDRYASAAELHDALRACQRRLTASVREKHTSRHQRVLAVAAGVLFVVIAANLVWTWRQQSRVRDAVDRLLPAIEQLSERGEYGAAHRLVLEAERHIPGDARLEELSREITLTTSVVTDPPDAEIRVREYLEPDAAWQLLGRSPLEELRIPKGLKRWSITKPGFHAVDAVLSVDGESPVLRFAQDKEGSIPPGMVRVTGGLPQGVTGLYDFDVVAHQDFFIDRYEVTNRQYAEFVSAGGYRRPEYWKHPLVKQGRLLSFAEAMDGFRDSTGRPGPASWEIGSYPTEDADAPVSGVSWHEAAAYAAFAGKDLPTVTHWIRAAFRQSLFVNGAPVLWFSNFTGDRPAPVRARHAMNPYGTFDMAGNVKEWCLNEAPRRGGARYILGGAFGEPVYMSHDPDAQSPFDRLPTYGFRCAKYISAPPASLTAPIDHPARDYTYEKPVSDEEFDVYRRFYAYDRTPLDARVESMDDAYAHWRLEKVSFNAAYGAERVIAYLFLPKDVDPPYQTIVYFPGSWALRERLFEERLREVTEGGPFVRSGRLWAGIDAGVAFIVRSGRAVMFPVYKSTLDRGDGLLFDRPDLTSRYRDHVVQWYKDAACSIAYLETRQEVDAGRLGFYGNSWGAAMGAIIPALEERLKAAVLVLGGFWQQKGAPEVEQINFAPRVKIPVLMLNGRHDFVFPYEASQIPMFNALGSRPADKSHVLVDSGHSVPARARVTHVLQWFDRYLGPTVK